VTDAVHTPSVTLTVNGREITAPTGATVLQACQEAGANIPTLCHDPRLKPYGACRLCIVEIQGMRGYPTSCTTVVAQDMVVTTSSDDLNELRAGIVELLLSDHKVDCLTCDASGRCGLQEAAYELGVEVSRWEGDRHHSDARNTTELIERDHAKCISCGRCVRICHEVQGCDVWGYTKRGFDALPDTPLSVPLLDAGCDFCGQCVSSCPTGALTDRLSRFRGRHWETAWTETTCGYCGVGCTIEFATKDGHIIGARAPLEKGPNYGNLCAKGRYGWGFAEHSDRLTTPLVRKDGVLTPATWDEALTLVAERLATIRDANGGGAIAGLSSAKCTNEENYLFQKLMRAGLQTNNVDHCARLCHSSTVAGLAASFGSGAMTNSIDDLGQADVVLVIGSNTTETHPIIGIELKKAALRGTRLFVLDPRRIPLTEHAEKSLSIRPGTNVALINAMMHVILDAGLADDGFIASRTENFEALRQVIQDYDVEAAADICGVSPEDIREVALAYGSAPAASIVYAMGVTQHSSGTNQVRALANLAMLTGNIGRPGTGVNPLRGQNNVQGACDFACLPNCLPGYQPISAESIDGICESWKTDAELPEAPGLTLIEMTDAALSGELKAMYIMGENPVIADPDQAHVLEALEALELLVVQDIFLTETASLADVVLPAASFLEKDGTFTNTDRRVKRVRPVIDPPDGALSDLEIITRLFRLLGVRADYDSPADVMNEMSAVTPQYGGVSYQRLDEEGDLRWPCPGMHHPGTPILHTESFTRGRGQFTVVDYEPAPDTTTSVRPLIMTTGRHLWNFHTDTMIRHCEGLAGLNDHGYLEICHTDADALGICDGDRIEVTSKHGSVETRARVLGRGGPRPGVVFMPFHFAAAPANRITGTDLDPTAKMPSLKVTSVSVLKLPA
jgi:formate dehydrogenase alpha subunit